MVLKPAEGASPDQYEVRRGFQHPTRMDEGPGLSGAALGAATSAVFGSLPCVLRREFGLSQYELRRILREIGRIPVSSQ